MNPVFMNLIMMFYIRRGNISDEFQFKVHPAVVGIYVDCLNFITNKVSTSLNYVIKRNVAFVNGVLIYYLKRFYEIDVSLSEVICNRRFSYPKVIWFF